MRTFTIPILAVVLLVIQSPVRTGAAEQGAWQPPPPPPDEFDWVQLTSGEWLKGEFRAMYEEELEFDSDKLGLLKLDWSDVQQVRTEKPLSVRFEPDQSVVGKVRMKEDTVTVADETSEAERTFPRDTLVSAGSGEPSEFDLWHARFSLGANYRSGNTDEREFSALLDLRRRTDLNRFRLDYIGRYLETDGVESQNNHLADVRWDRFLTKRLFLTPVFGQYFRDPFQNLAHRVTLATGLGYQIIDTDKTEWDITVGPAYRHTKFDSTPEGASGSEDGFGGILLSELEIELTEWVDFTLGYSGYVMDRDSGGYGHSAIATLSFEIGDPFEFNISYLWDYVQDPTENSDGVVPENSDFRLLFGIGVEF